jgi:UDP-glucose 6-dehydrogenase
MKKIWKFAFAAFAVFAFTACGTDNNTTTESDTMETTDEVETDMDTDLDEDTTIVVEDTTVDDGVADEIKEEQPPVQ